MYFSEYLDEVAPWEKKLLDLLFIPNLEFDPIGCKY